MPKFELNEVEMRLIKTGIERLINKDDYNEQWRNSVMIPAAVTGVDFDCYVTLSVQWRRKQPQPIIVEGFDASDHVREATHGPKNS